MYLAEAKELVYMAKPRKTYVAVAKESVSDPSDFSSSIGKLI